MTSFVSEMSEALAEYVEKARENDPKELKREIARLKKELGQKNPSVQTERIEVPVISFDDMQVLFNNLANLEVSAEKIIQMGEEMKTYADMVTAELDQVQKTVARFQVGDRLPRAAIPDRSIGGPIKTAVPAARKDHINSEISAPQQRILDALMLLSFIDIKDPLRTMVAFLATQSPRSSGFKNNLGYLRSQGCIEYVGGDRMRLLDAGFTKANAPQGRFNAESFQEIVLAQLPMPQARILRVLVEAGGEPVSRVDVADQAGQSFTSSGYKNNLGSLRSLGLIDYAGPEAVRAMPIMFLE